MQRRVEFSNKNRGDIYTIEIQLKLFYLFVNFTMLILREVDYRRLGIKHEPSTTALNLDTYDTIR